MVPSDPWQRTKTVRHTHPHKCSAQSGIAFVFLARPKCHEPAVFWACPAQMPVQGWRPERFEHEGEALRFARQNGPQRCLGFRVLFPQWTNVFL